MMLTVTEVATLNVCMPVAIAVEMATLMVAAVFRMAW